MQPKLKLILSDKVTKFCEHCTLHGVHYLIQRGRCARAAWSAIMAAGIALCAVLSHAIWDKFNIDPTVTVVESTHYSTERIPFPNVMICDTQPVYGPNTGNISHVLYSRGYDIYQIDEFFNSFFAIKKRGYIPPPYVKKMHSLLADLGFTLEVLEDMFKKPCDEMMVQCSWRTKFYNCQDMFQEVRTVMGHCCQFEMAYFKQRAPRNTTFTPGKEPTEALDITINGRRIYADGSGRDQPTLMYIYDSANTITLLDSSISLTASSYYDVDMEIWAIDSSNDVKDLSLSTRKCVLPTDRGIGASFYQKCLSMHMLRQVIAYCKCMPFEFSANDLSITDYQACTWEKYLCIYEILEKTHADMNTLIHTHKCYQKCDYVEYETVVDNIKRTRKYGLRNNSYIRVTVHYGSNTCMKYRREVLYTWDQMLANLGGIFGLCLGGSLVSIIEIIWFISDLLFTSLYGFRKTKLTPAAKKIAFVTEKDVFKKKEKNKDGCYKFAN